MNDDYIWDDSMNPFADPAKQIEFKDRRTKGCFSCVHSKYGVPESSTLKTHRGYCEPEEQGLIAVDYPNEDKLTCTWYQKR